MSPFGKLVTAGIALVTGTSLLTSVTTAYMIRSPEPADTVTGTYAPAPVRPVPAPRQATPAASRTTPDAPRAIPVATTVTPVATTASDCATGGDRAWRIAKPGVLGGLLGAGLGAAGGAIAGGGSGAGKGALIGGLAGAAAGTGYGAYKTENECGTIIGTRGFTDGAVVPGVAERGPVTEAALRPSATNGIASYNVR